MIIKASRIRFWKRDYAKVGQVERNKYIDETYHSIQINHHLYQNKRLQGSWWYTMRCNRWHYWAADWSIQLLLQNMIMHYYYNNHKTIAWQVYCQARRKMGTIINLSTVKINPFPSVEKKLVQPRWKKTSLLYAEN